MAGEFCNLLFYYRQIHSNFADSILSIPGSGDFIQQKIQRHSRLTQGLLHLAQTKHILQYMINMVESIEHETEASCEKYV